MQPMSGHFPESAYIVQISFALSPAHQCDLVLRLRTKKKDGSMSQVKRRATAARPQTSRRQFLQLEQLEERAVLAGNVLAYNIAGYLTLIGDSASK
jgi:hypothetical protein